MKKLTDAHGNRTAVTTTVNGISETTAYTFDALNRLASVTDSNNQATNYSYDAVGNRQTVAYPNGNTTTYSYDSQHRLTDVTTTDSLSNILSGFSYVLDNSGRRSQVTDHSGAANDRYYLYDGLGSTRALSNASGNVTDTYDYSAYGSLIDSTGTTENSYLYTGEQYDANTNNYYLRARYYDPSVGRFTQMDTFQGVMNQPLTLHKYLYANGDPVNGVDPSGQLTLIGLNIGMSNIIRNEALAAGVARVTANRIAGKAIERFIEGQLQRFVAQYGGQVLRQVYFKGPGGRRFADAVVQLGDRFVAIEVKTNLPLAGRALSRLGGQIKTFASGSSPKLTGTAAEVIVITEESAAAIETSFAVIESKISAGTLAGALEGTTQLVSVLRAVLLGL